MGGSWVMYDFAHLESPAAFAAEFMQHEVQAGGIVVVGSRWVLSMAPC